MEIQEWLFIISIMISIFVGIKCRSKCCGKDCSFSLEKEEVDNEILRSIKIGRKSKIKTNSNDDNGNEIIEGQL